MRTHVFAAMMVGLLAAACQPAEQARSPSAPPQPYSPNFTNSAQVCTDYGFAPGTSAFDLCVSRERAARAAGRVDSNYAEARLTSDAQNACDSYGLAPSSPRYQTCITREIDARRYQGSSQATPSNQRYRTDQHGNRIDAEGNRVDIYGNRLS